MMNCSGSDVPNDEALISRTQPVTLWEHMQSFPSQLGKRGSSHQGEHRTGT